MRSVMHNITPSQLKTVKCSVIYEKCNQISYTMKLWVTIGDPDALVVTALIVVVALTSLCIAFPFSMLLFFHFTLISSGETTYT
jgi:hypothetical protein